MTNILKPGYLRWDGLKFVLDPDIEVTGAVGPQGAPGPIGPGLGIVGANEQPVWYIDSINGDNDRDGATPNTSINSIAEFTKRIGAQVINSGVTVNILQSDASFWDIDINVGITGVVTFVGQKNIVISSTLSVVNVWNPNTQTIGSYQLSGNPDISTFCKNSFIQTVGGNKFSPIGKSLGAGAFNGVWRDTGDNSTEPSVSDAIEIYQINSVNLINISAQGSGTINFVNIEIDQLLNRGLTNISLRGCKINVLTNFSTPNSLFISSSHVGSLTLANTIGDCFLSGNVVLQSSIFYRFTAFGFGNITIVGPVIIQNTTLNLDGNTNAFSFSGPVSLCITPFGMLAINDYDDTGIGIEIGANSLLRVESYLFIVADNAENTGIHIKSGGYLFFKSGFLPVVAAVQPSAPWNIGGISKTQLDIALGNGFVNSTNLACVAIEA